MDKFWECKIQYSENIQHKEKIKKTNFNKKEVTNNFAITRL